MATFTEGSNDGAMNGTTPVTLVAAPAASTRRIVKWFQISNRDTAAVTLTVRFLNGASTRVLVSAMTLAVGDTLVWNDGLVLDTTAKSITALLSGAAATTNPDFVASFGDATS